MIAGAGGPSPPRFIYCWRREGAAAVPTLPLHCAEQGGRWRSKHGAFKRKINLLCCHIVML
jgi:hypothetical protein